MEDSIIVLFVKEVLSFPCGENWCFENWCLVLNNAKKKSLFTLDTKWVLNEFSFETAGRENSGGGVGMSLCHRSPIWQSIQAYATRRASALGLMATSTTTGKLCIR